MLILVVVLILVALALLATTAMLAKRLREAAARLTALDADWQAADDDVRAALADQPRLLLTVDVRNALELARSRSKLGARLIAFAPRLVTQRVYETIARQLEEQLAAQGVEADIDIVEGQR